MAFLLSQRKIVVIALGIVLVASAGLFVLRRQIPAPDMSAEEPGSSVFGSASGEKNNSNAPAPPSISASPTVQVQEDNPAPPPVSVPYRGRPADEVRPVAIEVAGYSEDQRQKLYGTIRNDGAAVKSDPNLFNIWIELGLLKKSIGDYEGARDAWEYAGAIRPKNVVSFANLGEIYASYLKDAAKAEKNFKIAIANKPDEPAAYITLSDFYSAEKRVQDAIDILLKGNTANPTSVDVIKMLGRRYEEVKNYMEAILWWQKVLVLEPGNAAVAAEIDSLKKKLNP
ncbi:MAG: hypothetical protein Q8Q94_00185 [bacterium]|nr:hypothetical protein [bacterium]MDZ4299850.1 hypothetical protein [Candidatus Sungbacteria bacterium]